MRHRRLAHASLVARQLRLQARDVYDVCRLQSIGICSGRPGSVSSSAGPMCVVLYTASRRRLEIFKGLSPEGQVMAVAETIAFALFAAVTLACSIGAVLVRDVWHAALLLGAALVSVAIHYIMLQAEFIAAMQILVYVGGVLILITFAVMFTRDQSLEVVEG